MNGWYHSREELRMSTLSKNSAADLEFNMTHRSSLAEHTERYHARNVNMWRDLFHPQVYRRLVGATVGDRFAVDFRPGEIVAPYRNQQRFDIRPRQFNRNALNGNGPDPIPGRFYPKGLLRGITGIFPQNIEPFRVVDVEPSHITVEFNHPLSRSDLRLDVIVRSIRSKISEHGGTCNHWSEKVTDGPGMQIRENGKPTGFLTDHAFLRTDTDPDKNFYNKPRFVNHLDDMAMHLITELYGDLLEPEMAVLDLMSSWVSHLPVDLHLDVVAGLGMNRLELAANEQLTHYTVHDLNARPELPYEDSRFDAVICTVSVEYMTQPLLVFDEVARVLRHGGLFILTFSNRWFPPKVVNIWKGLHDFERMGLVLEYFSHGKQFINLETLSIRGFPRPVHDKYFSLTRLSDPVYAVWGWKG
jgi:SAM-dependent methyltransferase